MRFQPDTSLEAWLRPVAMAAPDANVYVEIMAPDFRFLFALVLLVLLAAMRLAGRRAPRTGVSATPAGQRPVFVLLAVLGLSFVPWLATSGNGRYFAVSLLVVGPVCVGLVRLLPATRALRLTLAGGMVALQAFAVQQSAPWRAWSMVPWTDAPYFHVEVPPEARSEPATYVTMSAISYSLLAPQFHPRSRWMSLHNAPAPGGASPAARRTEAFLAAAQPGRLKLLVPAVEGMATAQRLPNAQVSAALHARAAQWGLGLSQPQSCRFLPSRGLAHIGLGAKTPEQSAQAGFWLCDLTRLAPATGTPPADPARHDRVFEALEAQCPRFFPRGGDGPPVALPNGALRSYLGGEMKAYVYDSGEVAYKYYRALNPVILGQVPDVLAGRSALDCGSIRGRAGLPWEREI